MCYALFAEIGDGGQNREREEVAEEAEYKLVDADVKCHLGDDVVTAVEQLRRRHRRMGPPHIPSISRRR